MKKIFLVFIATMSFMSCDKTLDRLLVNPNNPSPDQADANLYLNQAELSFAGFFNTASGFGMELTRMISMFGPRYDNTYTPQSYDGIWNTAYTGVIKHCNALIPIADAQKRYVHVGMAKIMKAYTFLTLVDMFGNVPFTEANLGVDNLNPKADPGANVYAAAIALLDEAITDLGKTSSATPGSQDLFFGGNATRWITTAKTLKLRALMNTRLVDPSAKTKIEAILSAGDLIDNNTNHSEDFEFKYSKKGSNPNSRHPRYNGNHTSTGAGDYIGTYFMWSLAQEKGTGDANNDPRTRYYLYRQETNYAAVTENTINCFGQAYPGHYATGLINGYTGATYDMPFCLLISGFWGRDHGDDAGIPPDGQLRTTVGVYPFGGRFDGNEGASVAVDFGGQGAGIQPLWQSSYTEFLRAEYELMLNNSAADARTRLENGVRYSIKKVIEFPSAISYPGTISTTLVPDATKIDNYVNKVLTAFDNATSTSAKLNIIMKEYYMALWGNGVDAYNLFRRTNKPENIQYVLEANPGPFINSHLYPSVFVNRNLNAAQKANVGVQVFWDNWPANSRR
ncbi:MAG TPA: SusD/RagB family nutrient-binding outer membrane lipoprotein [Chitinophagaceae bacterium]|nr:SusD/RagB family nutrient-binding outer membrane lipoprotein [Chitinophagaceae bacterium]